MQVRLIVMLIALFGMTASPVAAATFFSDDFESYDFDADVAGVGGWTVSHTTATLETEADWHLLDTWNVAGAFGLPASVHFGPATTGGSTTVPFGTAPGIHGPSGDLIGGRFIASGSDGIPVSTASQASPPYFPTFLAGTTPADPELPDNDPWDSRIDNGTYTGASNDIITPSFSTVGASGDVWLHSSISAALGDNGQAIFDIDVSIDGGTTWENKFRRIAPGNGRNIASGDFDSDLDVDGIDFLTQQRLMNWADTGATEPHDNDANRRGTDQRYSDWSKAFNGSYTPLVATVADGNAGGVHGELDINLGAIGGNADVKVRYRHFESRDDESIYLDNVRIDESAPLGSATETIFEEDFNTMTLGAMDVYTFVHAFGAFGTDSGHGSSTISGHSWGAQDRPTISYSDENEPTQGPPVIEPRGRYDDTGLIRGRTVNHLGHPIAEGASGEVPFAIIDPKAEPEDSGPSLLSFQSERMHTPVLDLSGYDTVILEWDDEAVIDGNPFFGSVASVVLMLDDDGTAGPSDGDTVLNEPDKFGAGGLYDPYAPYDQYAGGAFASDDPIFTHHRIDVSADAAGVSNIYFAWQYVSSRTHFWAVDNIKITGELTPALAAIATPEPTSLMLALVGLSVLGTRRRRSRLG